LTKICRHAILPQVESDFVGVSRLLKSLEILMEKRMQDLPDIQTTKTTRERVLNTLLTHPHCTINEIAEMVEINPISVRHHIDRLQADGMVDAAEERHGVGRPRRVYFLTENGREHFPTRYLRLTLRLLEQLKGSLPPSMVDQLFMQMARDLASDHAPELAGLSTEERLNLVKKLLTNEGFTVDWARQGNYYEIRETNCPYYHVGQDHPEVCSVDQTLISTVLAVPAEKIQCMLYGDAHCTFVVPITSINEVKS
jgi:DeoR family transcriptional regulator, suf operon transcriptional repressor